MIEEIGRFGLPVFADVKLHDIPNTVAGAARGLGAHGARWVTVHGFGGVEMIRAAVEGLTEGSDGEGGVLVVTVLTSLDEAMLGAVGVDRGVGDQVALLGALAAEAGAEGVVCAVGEIARARTAAPGLMVVTPGIRMAGAGRDDQKRADTLGAALSAGADMVVVGRAITGPPTWSRPPGRCPKKPPISSAPEGDLPGPAWLWSEHPTGKGNAAATAVDR